MTELALYGLVLAAALGESTAFVGLLIPGVGVLLAAAVLAARGQASLGWVGAAAALGAVAGFGASYYLGRAGGFWAARWGARAKNPVEKALRLVSRLGGWAVFWGHFFGPVRAFVAFAAGAGGLAPRVFWVASVLGGVAWGYGLAAAGALASGGWALVEAHLGRGSVLVAVVAALLYLVLRVGAGALALGLHLVPSATRPILALLEASRAAPASGRRPPGAGPVASLGAWLKRRLASDRPEGLLLTLGGLVCASFAWLFFGVVEDLLFRDPLVRLDEHIFALLQALRSPAGDRLFLAITFLASGPVLAASLVAAAAGLLALGRRFQATLLVLGFGAGEMLVWAIKAGWGRPRPLPDVPLAAVSGPAFPSNHAFSCLALYGLLAYLAGRGLKSPAARGRLYAVVGVVVVAVGLSRLYLGVHWLSDVVGGYALGGIWLTALVTAVEAHDRIAPPRREAAPVARQRAAGLAVATAIAAAWAGAAVWGLPAERARSRPTPTYRVLPAESLTEEVTHLAGSAVEDLLGRPVGTLGLAIVAAEGELRTAAASAGWPPAEGLRAGAVLPRLVRAFRGEFDPLEPTYPFFWRSRPQDLSLVRPERGGRQVARLWRAGRAEKGGGDIWVGWVEMEPPPSQFLGIPLPPIAAGPQQDAGVLRDALLAGGRGRLIASSPLPLVEVRTP